MVFLVTLILGEGKVLKQNADESPKKGGEGESQEQEESQKGESDPTKGIEATPGGIEPQPGAAQKSVGDGEENKGGEEENPGSSKDGNDDGGIGENVDIDGSGDGQKAAESAKMQNTEPFESGEALNGSNSSSQGKGTSPPLNHTLDQTDLEAVVSPGDGDGMDEIDEPTQAAGYVQASSFEAASPPSSSSSSSSPLAVNLQEPPSITKDKMSKGDTDPEKVAPDGSKDKGSLEDTNIAQKDVEAQSPDTSAKGPNPGSKDVKASESDPDQNDKDKIVNEEDAVDDKDTVEVVKEPKIDTPLETDFQKQMSSETKDPPQSNFFSYFIVLAIITIIVYLVFHNKKKILGLIVEGRSGRQSGRRRSGGREYRKLDSNMEDMMETGRETSMRQVIY